MSVTLDKGWINDGQGNRIPLWSGEFHYFRNERRHWRRILRAMKDAGLTVVTSFVQPNWHEYEPGKFDFEGRTAPERDLPHLLELAKEIGLYAQLRLGPACCEWRESGGTSFGTPWRAISDAFWDVVGNYEVGKGGSLLLYQIHNEWSHPLGMYYVLLPYVSAFDGFRAPSVPHWLELCGPNPHYLSSGYEFSMEYLPRYLASLYPDTGTMNDAWGTRYAGFESVKEELTSAGAGTLHGYITHCLKAFAGRTFPGESPRRVLDLLNWANLYMAAPLSEDVDHTRLRTSLPIVHNWSMGDERKWSSIAHLDLAGYDMYAPTDVDIWQWNKNTCDMQSSPFPMSNEFMCGTIERYEWGGQGFYTDSFARMEILSYLMGGMKGVNLYMFVERDNWLQCPLDERGGKRQCYHAISAMVKALTRNKWHEARMLRDLGVFKNTDYHRFFDGHDDGMFDEGYRDAHIRDSLYRGHSPKQQFVATFRTLHDTSIDFEVFKDTRGGESLSEFKAVLAYSLWFMDRGAARDLLEFVERGGALVIFPCIPTHADDGRELDIFTKQLGLEPFAEDQNAQSHVDVASVDLEEVLHASSGAFRTADGRLWAQSRSFGRGKVLALNAQLADYPEALERVVTEWAGCRKYVSTRPALTDGGMALHPDGHAVAAIVNGGFEGRVAVAGIDVSRLPAARVYAVSDELTGRLIGNFEPAEGVVAVPIGLAPRDGALLRIAPGAGVSGHAQPAGQLRTSVAEWHTRREDEAVYRNAYLGPEIDESWADVPIEDWTLPAIASGKVLGVQGWFYMKQQVRLPESPERIYLHLRPNGYHNLGLVYLNGRECGRFMVERPGGESIFDVTDLIDPGGRDTLAVRLYRNSLDCHDRGASGFSVLQFECGVDVVPVDRLYLKQERRNFGEINGWAAADTSDLHWSAVTLPCEFRMRREGDAMWLRSQVCVDNPSCTKLLLTGSNCVVSVFVNGEYVVKSPMLPCEFVLSESLVPGTNNVALRIAPDSFENYTVPKEQRYRSWIQDGLLPLTVRLESVELLSPDTPRRPLPS